MLAVIVPWNAAAHGQAPHTIVGSVIDSVTGRAVGPGTILIPELGVVEKIGEDGAFGIAGVAPGSYRLAIRVEGYRARAFSFELASDHPAVVPAGVISLAPGVDAVGHLAGTVSSWDGQKVAGALVAVDGRLAARADRSGRYRIADVGAGLHVISVQSIGFRPRGLYVDLDPGEPELRLDVDLEPVPFTLEPIVVDVDRVVYVHPRLREFYDRRALGSGHYVTRFDVEERTPQRTTDLLRNMAGFSVVPGLFGTWRVRTTRGAQCAEPIVYLDGIEMLDAEIDLWIRPQDVEGIEAYSGPASAPAAYGKGTTCGVILIWTR